MNSTGKIRTATLAIGGAALGLLSLTSPAAAATSDAAATQLLTKYNCQACHTVDKKLVGPSYKEIAAKYAGDAVWGAIPMPPNNVPDADLKTLVEWILALK